ncbi:MAG TPA: aldo/keto reductase, partial [Edaphobacter sp.]|nr:aldo/keto reductase [Edaphobacter sp.]
HYGLTLPVSVIITGIDNTQVLDQAFEAARTFRPLDQAQMNSLLARTATAASDGKFELFKTTAHYDGTAANPKWLG